MLMQTKYFVLLTQQREIVKQLRIRNWDKWQSYRRDRGQPPWIKVHRVIMRDLNWVSLSNAQRGQLLAIWLLAADNDGVIPASAPLLKQLCHMDHEPELEVLIDQGFVCPDAIVTPSWRQVDFLETETETETEAEADSTVAARPDVGAAPQFEELKLIFPRRAGSQPWHDAKKAINARIREGHTWDEILAGAKRYAAFCRATGKEHSEHVMQAKRFCGPAKPFLESFDLPATTADNRLAANLSAAEKFKARTGGGTV